MTEAETLRARARRCRETAREYDSDAGASLLLLAAELELRADRIELKAEPPRAT
jgi:hypothetical protein